MNNLAVMTKKSTPFFLVLSVFCLFILGSCSKEDDNACLAEAQVVSSAAQLYAASPGVQTCANYKGAIQRYLNSACGATLSATDRQSFENILSRLPC
jgi:uncharacterized protein YaaR (DUF327 family)